jgi:hypothetical protein
VSQTLKKILPWLFCAGIFAYLFTTIHPKDMAKALALADLPRFFYYSAVYFVLVLYLDCFALKHFISRFAATITFRESWLVRGASYFLMIFNYGAGQGSYAIYLKKAHGAPLAKTLGTIGFISVADALLVFTSALIASSFQPVIYQKWNLSQLAQIIVPLIYLFYGVWIWFWKNCDRPFLVRGQRFRIIKWFVSHDVFFIFREATRKDYLMLFILRAPLLVIVIAGYRWALLSFQTELSWHAVFTYNPIIMFASALPLTPAGLGTSQVLSIELLKDLIQSPLITSGTATAANILLTSSLLWFLANQVLKALFGLYALTQISRKLFKETF